MGKKSKGKTRPEQIVGDAIEVRENVLSYTDYNTIMSIQLLIDRLNEIINNQREIHSMFSSLREEVDSISAYLMALGDRQDGNKGQPGEDPFGKVKETLRGAGEDNSARTDE